MLASAANSSAQLQADLTSTVAEWSGAIRAAYPEVTPFAAAGTIPDQLKRHVLAQAVWTYLRNYPKLQMFKTDERKQAAADAEKAYEKVLTREYGAIEFPGGVRTTGFWNAKPKLVMRTDPVPEPDVQFQTTQMSGSGYVNPNAPADKVPSTSPGNPEPVSGLQAVAEDGQVVLTWDPAYGAASYSVFRGTASGQESVVPVASLLTVPYYLDAGLANGTTYYYVVRAENGSLVSPLSGEVQSTPNPTQV